MVRLQWCLSVDNLPQAPSSPACLPQAQASDAGDRHRRADTVHLPHVRDPRWWQEVGCASARARHDGPIVRAMNIQRRSQEAQNLWFVINHQDACTCHVARGRLMVMMVPGAPSRGASGRGLCAVIMPPIASISPRAMARPRPVPGRAVRTSDPIEAVKHLRQIGLRNARTFIGNGDADLVTATCAADTDQRPIRAVTR